MKCRAGHRRVLLSLWLAAAVSACGGSGGGPSAVSNSAPTPSASDGRVVIGAAAKGPMDSSIINLLPIDALGNVSGQALVTTQTDANGSFTANVPAGAGVLLIRATGGSYVDEADQEPDPALKRRIFLADNEGLESLLPVGVSTVTVSVVTQAILDKTRRESQGADFLERFASNRSLAASAYGFDVVTTMPANPITPAAGSTDAQRQYAMVLGGIANLVNRVSIDAEMAEPTIEVILAVAQDLSDGRIDGLVAGAAVMLQGQAIAAYSLNEEIARFRNNNFDAYATTPLIAVDEAVLSQISVVNEAPIAIDDAYTLDPDAVLTIDAPGVLANDSDPEDSPLTAVLVSGPAHAESFILEPDGQFQYIHNGTAVDVDSFSYVASDGALESNVATVTLTFNPISVTLSGLVEGADMALADVVVTVDGTASGAGPVDFPTTAATDGSYSVTIETIRPDDFVSVEATGTGDNTDLIFRSYLGSVQSLLDVSGQDGIVDSSELNTVNLTALSTVISVLADEQAPTPIINEDILADAVAALDSSTLIRLAAAVKTLIDSDTIDLGIETTTIAALSNPALRRDIGKLVESAFPDPMAIATAQVAAGSLIPYSSGEFPATINLTAHGNLLFTVGGQVVFNADGTGFFSRIEGTTDTTWSLESTGNLRVDFLMPFVTEFMNGAGELERQSTDRITIQRFYTGGRANHVFVLDHTVVTFPQNPTLPSEEINGIPAPVTARLGVRQTIPFNAAALPGQGLTVTFYHTDNASFSAGDPEIGFDTLDFNMDGSGVSRRRQFPFSWSVDALGRIDLQFANGDRNIFTGLLPEDDGVTNTLLTAEPAVAPALAQRVFAVTRDESLVFDLPALENRRYRGLGSTELTLTTDSGLPTFDFEFTPGGDACRVPGSGQTEWSWISTGGRVEISRTFINGGDLITHRTWQPIRQIGNRFWTIETREGMFVDANSTPGRHALQRLEQSLDGNTRPIANDDTLEIERDTTIHVPLAELLANDVDPEDDEIILLANDGQSASGGSIAQVTSLNGGLVGLVYTPPAGFVGTDSFGYTVSDLFCQTDPAPAMATVIINVLANRGGTAPAAEAADEGAQPSRKSE